MKKILFLISLMSLSACVRYKGQVVFNYSDSHVDGVKRDLSGNLKVKGRDLSKLKILLETLKITVKDQ